MGCRLIVNADDFGLSTGINRGIVECHQAGIVTSASLMVRRDAAEHASRRARQLPSLSVGLHLDLGEWSYEEDEWRPVYTVVPLDDADAVAAEIDRQLECFRELMASDPTHLDSHQHVHLREPARSLVLEHGARLGVPVRHFSRVTYCGEFYGQTTEGHPLPAKIAPQGLIAVLQSLAADATELACHPGYGVGSDTMYGAEREIEVSTLCDSRVRAAMDALGLELVSFREISLAANRS